MSGGFEQAAMDRMIEDGEKFFSSYLTQADDVLFGEVWNGEAIDVKTKCIITVVSLMASGITDSSLTYHLQNAKAHGVTKEEIAAIITHATMYVGWPKGWAVFRLAKEVWNEEVSELTESGSCE